MVLPAFRNGEVFLVLDIDSEQVDYFNSDDETYLREIIQIIEKMNYLQ
jgi:GAF domain-containing protein